MSTQIIAHLPGTFYRTPSPDAPAYKEVGDAVSEGDVVGLIEVMKSFHELRANVSGTVKAFLVNSEEAVMPGQPLVEIE